MLLAAATKTCCKVSYRPTEPKRGGTITGISRCNITWLA